MYDHLLDHMPYRDRITFERDGEGTVDENGIYTATTTTVLTSPCDVQEDRRLVRYDAQGDAYRDADAVVYFPRAAGLSALQTNDRATVEQQGVIRSAKVLEVNLFDDMVILTWL